jgi:hypothetical protein
VTREIGFARLGLALASGRFSFSISSRCDDASNFCSICFIIPVRMSDVQLYLIEADKDKKEATGIATGTAQSKDT